MNPYDFNSALVTEHIKDLQREACRDRLAAMVRRCNPSHLVAAWRRTRIHSFFNRRCIECGCA
jgi:hypothetical protein